MKRILIGCDVDLVRIADPVLRTTSNFSASGENPWSCLDNIDALRSELGSDFPLITWLIRADESVRLCTGTFDSGYVSRAALWQALLEKGHELGWHMHTASLDHSKGCFTFDPEPRWLDDAFAALARHYCVKSTRTGWDHANDALFSALDRLGIAVDFSALPGNLAWFRAGTDPVVTNWLRCSEELYRPSKADYQRPGDQPLKLIEIPITQFRQSPTGAALRYARRIAHGYCSLKGLWKKTRQLTQRWPGLPASPVEPWAFYFHPEDLGNGGIANFKANLQKLREAGQVEF